MRIDDKLCRADIILLSNEELVTVKQWIEDELIQRVLHDDSWDDETPSAPARTSVHR